jgi:hypothetical protein
MVFEWLPRKKKEYALWAIIGIALEASSLEPQTAFLTACILYVFRTTFWPNIREQRRIEKEAESESKELNQ